jgi:nucleotide-binding universal stress UspA family protein
MGYRNVLVTLDGSKLAERALEPVLQIANQKANIHLLSIMSEDRTSEIAALASAIVQPHGARDENWPPIQSPRDPRAVHAREAYLEEVREWLESLGYSVTIEVRPGNVVETILSVARDRFDVIVIASHSRTGLSKIALGSVAEGVLHKSPCPIRIIPANDANTQS